MEKKKSRLGPPASSWWFSYAAGTGAREIRVVVLSLFVRVLIPPLFFSAIPKRAIGFSFPGGREGAVVGASLLVATGLVGGLLWKTMGPLGLVLIIWASGATIVLMLYGALAGGRVAFVKEYCSACRLRPLIEEHEAMHLYGERSEEVVWSEARKKHSYESLSLADDPMICSFCPIARKLREK